MRKGRELRELLQQVVKLRSAHKMTESDLLLEAAAAADDSSVGEALVKKRAQQLRGELFTFGGLELTRAILAQFLSLPEVKLLLPEATRQAQQEAADSKTAIALLEAASKFLHEVLKSKGRRSDEDRNAFWSSIVALLPSDLFEKRMCAAAMRLLKVCPTMLLHTQGCGLLISTLVPSTLMKRGLLISTLVSIYSQNFYILSKLLETQVPRRVIKRATTMRGDLEDRAQGWQRIKSNGHKDKVDGSIISEAWHR